jgi:hypothetical protein
MVEYLCWKWVNGNLGNIAHVKSLDISNLSSILPQLILDVTLRILLFCYVYLYVCFEQIVESK